MIYDLEFEYNPKTTSEAFREYITKFDLSPDKAFAIIALNRIDTIRPTLDRADLDELKELARAYVDYAGSPALLHIGKGSD